MSIFVGILVTFTIVSGINGSQRKTHPHEIIGSEDSYPGQVPYHVSIRYKDIHNCSGALVEISQKQVILTTAFCSLVTGGKLSHYSVVGGSINKAEGGKGQQIRKVVRFVQHEDYNDDTFANDIALILLDSPFEYTDDINPIALPNPEQQTPGQVVISGWGTSSVLQTIQVPAIPDSICQEAYLDEIIYPSMHCAGFYKEAGKSSCHGESGSPVRAVDGGYLTGVVSSVYGCNDTNYPTVSTEVSYFINWIIANVD